MIWIAPSTRTPKKAISRCSRTVVRRSLSDRSTARMRTTAKKCSRSASEPQNSIAMKTKESTTSHARTRHGGRNRPTAAAMQAIVPPEAPTSNACA